MPDTLENHMQKTVNRNLLKYAAGRAIFCPNCESIMDWKRTVVATIHTKQGDNPEQCVKSYTVCAKCWDKLGCHVSGGVEKYNAKNTGTVATLEIVDGRKA